MVLAEKKAQEQFVDKQFIERLLNKRVAEILPVVGGGNNKICCVILQDGEKAALKIYSKQEPWRLQKEYMGFSLLTKMQANTTPKVLTRSDDEVLALYEWIDGERIDNVGQEELDALIHFTKQLNDLAKLKEAKEILPATDACFSIEDIKQQIQRRLDRFLTESLNNDLLKTFIHQEFIPEFDTQITTAEQNINTIDDLDYKYCTLSPSDFGFHNALRRQDGRLVFLDFEYFGWDDPVTMISDFLWHPGMNLTQEQKQYFLGKISLLFSSDSNFKPRLINLFPLFGLIWVLIILNEFLPQIWARRLAGGRVFETDKEKIQKQQLEKAKNYLFLVKKSRESFPYDL